MIRSRSTFAPHEDNIALPLPPKLKKMASLFPQATLYVTGMN